MIVDESRECIDGHKSHTERVEERRAQFNIDVTAAEERKDDSLKEAFATAEN